jgi:predicted flap endonuclease-1-like 5' DNA nuclease
MPTDRSTRTLLAAIFLMLALFVAMNYAADMKPLLDWWLPLILFLIGFALAASTRLRETLDTDVASSSPVYVREYSVSDGGAVARLGAPDVETLGSSPRAGAQRVGSEQPGEVNVREPKDEEESQSPLDAPRTRTTHAASAPAKTTPTAVNVPAAPQTVTPANDAPSEAERQEDRLAEDMVTGGDFVPPLTMEQTLNPPTESDSAAGVVVNPSEAVGTTQPNAYKDAARAQMPLEPLKPEVTPPVSEAERLERGDDAIQPSQTAENEFQSGEHVAHSQPTRMPPIVTQTTGEGMGAGNEPLPPEQQTVLEKMSNPPQPYEPANDALTRPDVVDAVVNDTHDAATAEGIAPSETIAPTSAAGEAAGSTPDDLTVIEGIGPKMAAALRAAGIDSFTKLSMTEDTDLRKAVEAAGMRLAPSLITWREQAVFLARGDRAGFDALRKKLSGGRRKGESGD